MAFNKNEGIVAEYYIAALGRVPDQAGFDFWVKELDKGMTPANLMSMFFSTDFPEVAEKYPEGQTSEETISAIYQNTFGREADAEGLAFWAEKLETSTKPAILEQMLAIAKDPANSVDGAYLASKKVDAENALDTTTEPEVPSVPGSTFTLTAGQDILVGTDGNDTFKAYIFDNQNTAQSGDMIDGGAGTDRLEADIGNSQKFAVSLHTTSVEQFAVRAQADNTNDSNDNNMDNNVQIDAERMDGTIWYESNNSRADVVIEDVRIERTEAYNSDFNQITKDITVAMVSTDAGDVDLNVYFDQHSLVAQDGQTKNSITLSVSNQVEATDFDAAKPLDNIPYTDVTFLVNGSAVKLNLDLTNVETYDQMWTAIQYAFNLAKAGDYSSLLANVGISRSEGTKKFNSKDGIIRYADEYVLNIENGSITPAVTGWNAAGGLPSTNAFGANVSQGDSSTTSNLITSTIVLDDVGRGSMGGDLVIGGMSTGDTSTSKGVEQFDIFVDRDSKLQNITSTANTLKEVYVKNRDHFADKNTTAVGSLTVTGSINNETKVEDDDETGVDSKTTIDAYGFNDVRVFDASEMKGSVNITAILSKDVVEKYMNLGDTASDNSADNAEFTYKLGTAADKLELTIEKDNLAAAGTTTREDFHLSIAGNGGDDTITTIIGDGTGIDTDAWYINSKINSNLAIDAGSGNDTIWTKGAGNFIINAGSGNDTVYTDNTGVQTVTVNTVAAIPAVAEVTTLTIDFNLIKNTSDEVTVTLNGTPITPVVVSNLNSNYANALLVAGQINSGTTHTATVNADNTITITAVTAGAQTDATSTVTTTSAGAVLGANNVTVTTQGADLIPAGTPVTSNIAYNDGKATFVLNAANADIEDLESNILAKTDAVNLGLTVTFQGITTKISEVASSFNAQKAISVTDLHVNQAIKAAIQADAVLSKLIVAEDGPSNTLIIKSLIDGTMQTADFSVDLINVNTAALATQYGVTSITAASLTSQKTALDAAYTAADTAALGAVAAAAGAGAKSTAALNAASTVDNNFTTELAQENGVNITGADSTAVSDNVIIGGTGDDVIVLGTDSSVLGGTSNDIIKYTGAFGNDTIVNFEAGDALAGALATSGEDLLDFSAITSKLDVAAKVAAGTVTTVNTYSATDTAAQILTKLLGSASINDTVASANSSTNVVLLTDANDATNGVATKAYVYELKDGLAINDASATLLGTITLADDGTDSQSWANIVADAIA